MRKWLFGIVAGSLAIAWAVNTFFPDTIAVIVSGGGLLLFAGLFGVILWGAAAAFKITFKALILPLLGLAILGTIGVIVFRDFYQVLAGLSCSLMLAVFAVLYILITCGNILRLFGMGGGGGSGKPPKPDPEPLPEGDLSWKRFPNRRSPPPMTPPPGDYPEEDEFNRRYPEFDQWRREREQEEQEWRK